MSLIHNPSIVTNSLIMYYDMNNTMKSWKGAPTTNLCNFNIATSGFNSDSPSNLTQTANNTTVTYEGRPSRKMDILAAGYCNYYIYNYNSGVSSGVFTASCKIKVSDGSNPNAFINAGYLYGTAGSFVLPVSFTALLDGWYRLSWTYSGTAMTLNSLTGLTGTASKAITFYITDYQLEALNVPTPFVTETRSSTQALLDLTNKYTLTPSNLTYNSNNTFSFSESANSTISTNLTVADVLPALSNFTIEAWVKVTAWPTNTFTNGYGSNTKAGSIVGGCYYSGTGLRWGGSSSGNSMYVFGFIRGEDAYRNTVIYNVPALNVYNHFVFTNNPTANSMSLYVNGVLFSTVSSATQQYTPSLVPSIGNLAINRADVDGGGTSVYSYLNGNIDAVKIYNKALSVAEVQQNFNAHRGRYGL